MKNLLFIISLILLGGCGRNEAEYYGYAKKEDSQQSKKIVLSSSEQISTSIQNNDWIFLDQQIKSGLSLNFILDSGRTLLNESVQWNQESIFKNLIQLGADPSIEDQTGNTTLEMCSEKINFLVILEPNRLPGYQKQLRQFLENEDFDEVKNMLELKMNPNFLFEDGESPLTFSIVNNLENAVRVIISTQFKTDINLKNAAGKSPLTLAKDLKLNRIERMLSGRGAGN